MAPSLVRHHAEWMPHEAETTGKEDIDTEMYYAVVSKMTHFCPFDYIIFVVYLIASVLPVCFLSKISFLWYALIGCVVTVIVARLVSAVAPGQVKDF